jgi:hypothetical protein
MLTDMTTIDDLQSLDLDGLQSVFEHDNLAKDAAVGLDTEQVFRRRGRHKVDDASQIRAAKDVLRTLPEDGESIHVVLAGSFANFDFVDAVLELAAPAVAEELTLATLGLNRRTADGLLRLLDAGTVRKCSLLACVYFESHDRELWGWIAQELARRGSRALAARNHTKLQLYGLSDGRRFAMESSANLRSCHMSEQACLTHDAGLYDFHRTWINSIFEKANA